MKLWYHITRQTEGGPPPGVYMTAEGFVVGLIAAFVLAGIVAWAVLR